MAQVSKRFLTPEMQNRIFDIFGESFMICHDRQTISSFLDDLLTPTEKTMLAKRVTIALLLLKGYEYQDINHMLKVSNQTIWTIKSWLNVKGKGYRTILGRIMKEERWKSFWDELDETITGLLFPIPTPHTDWKAARRKQWERIRAHYNSF